MSAVMEVSPGPIKVLDSFLGQSPDWYKKAVLLCLLGNFGLGLVRSEFENALLEVFRQSGVFVGLSRHCRHLRHCSQNVLLT